MGFCLLLASVSPALCGDLLTIGGGFGWAGFAVAGCVWDNSYADTIPFFSISNYGDVSLCHGTGLVLWRGFRLKKLNSVFLMAWQLFISITTNRIMGARI